MTARLRPRVPLWFGATAALLHIAIYALLLRPALSPTDLADPLYGWTMQISRATTMGLGSALGAFVAGALRDAIGRAERSVRERDLFGKYRLEER